MSPIISHARFNFDIPVSAWKMELSFLPDQWPAHFNSGHYDGAWTVLPLRSPGGKTDGIVPDLIGQQTFADTPLLAACPSIRKWMRSLQCPLMSVRLLNLKSGSVIKKHRDHELSFEQGEARLHIPVVTNPHVLFHINNIPLHMQEGECWYMNANLPHRVHNTGSTDRIHLVVDCQVNDWLQQRFHEASCYYAQQETSGKDQKMIITELRRQNTPSANRIADELENKLKAAEID